MLPFDTILYLALKQDDFRYILRDWNTLWRLLKCRDSEMRTSAIPGPGLPPLANVDTLRSAAVKVRLV